VRSLRDVADGSLTFNTAAALFGGLPDQLRTAYFDDKAQALFSSYKSQVDSGVDAATAYQNAYRSISPEALKAAELRMSDPKWKVQVAGNIKGLTTGFLASVPLVGRAFGGEAQNTQIANGWATVQLGDYYKANPNATDDQAKAWIQTKYKDNFVFDSTNKVDVQVPPGRASEQTTEALQAYTEKAQAKYGTDDLQVGLTGYRDGAYQLGLFRNGQYVGTALPQVSFDKIMQDHSFSKSFSPDEQASMAALTDKLNTGSATSQDLIDNAALLAKAWNNSLVNSSLQGKIKDIQSKTFNSAVGDVFNAPSDSKLGLGGPLNGGSNALNFPIDPALGNHWFINPKDDFSGLNGSRLTGHGSAMQVKQADQFLGSGNMTASLIAMGEGLVLKATDDPNPKSGKNVGYGYSLTANANTMPDDFRRAQIPGSSIEGIRNGTVQITPEQAARLLTITVPRYEERAKQAVEAARPGLWDKISAGQKAAISDVAYQVGSVSQFQKAIGALANKDIPAFQEALKVSYSDKNGNRQEDIRRNKLRNLAINGVSAWSQGLQEAYRTAQ
jgi:hypothetical protein